MMMCDNYRSVTLLCTTYNILINIVHVKLVYYVEEIFAEYQEAFKREDQLSFLQ
jgi:hypothetical protein